MKRVITLILLLITAGAGSLGLGATPAYAHGEAAQEAFLKTLTATFYDVKFSDTDLKRGEEFTITGTFKLLTTWPDRLTPPEDGEAFLSISAPGPRVLVKDRRIGGMFVPGRTHLERGKAYDFSLTMIARHEGRYHIHPVISFKKVGPLLGEGAWVSIKGGAPYKNPIELASGEVVELDTYGRGPVLWWLLVTILVGAAWLVYWLVPRPLLMRAKLLMTGERVEEELVTDRDRKVGVGFAGVIGVIILVGGIVASSTWSHGIPLQVRRHTPAAAEETHFVQAQTVDSILWSADQMKLAWNVKVTNTSQSPQTLRAFSTSTITFGSVGGDAEYPLSVGDTDVVAPGETRTFSLTMADPIWEQQRLLALSEVQAQLAGVLTFEDAQGHLERVEIGGELLPDFGGQANNQQHDMNDMN